MNTFRTITGEGLTGALGFAVRPLFLEIALCVVEDHLTLWMASGYIDIWIYRCGHTRETQNAYRVLVGDSVGTRRSRGGADISMDRMEIRVLLGCEVDENIYFLSVTPRCVCTPCGIFIYVIGANSYVIQINQATRCINLSDLFSVV
jgi:hypothetical protein